MSVSLLQVQDLEPPDLAFSQELSGSLGNYTCLCCHSHGRHEGVRVRSNAWVLVAPDSNFASFPDSTQLKGFLEVAADPTVALLIGSWRSVLVGAGARTWVLYPAPAHPLFSPPNTPKGQADIPRTLPRDPGAC